MASTIKYGSIGSAQVNFQTMVMKSSRTKNVHSKINRGYDIEFVHLLGAVFRAHYRLCLTLSHNSRANFLAHCTQALFFTNYFDFSFKYGRHCIWLKHSIFEQETKRSI